MTLDELLKISSKEWDTLSDDDLRRILTPYFAVTRPDPSRSNSTASTKPTKTKVTKSSAAELMALCKQLNLTIPTVTPK